MTKARLAAAVAETGGRLIRHARQYGLPRAKGHVTRWLFAGMVRKIVALPSPAAISKRSSTTSREGG